VLRLRIPVVAKSKPRKVQIATGSNRGEKAEISS
jgi:hypothetical protein